MATATHTEAGELFGQASRSFEAAMQSALRFQEESIRNLTEIVNEIGSPHKWQKKAQAMMQGMMTAAQKNVDDAVAVMNQNTKTSMELLQKAMETPQSKSDTEAQQKTREIWETTLGLVRANTEAILRANGRAIEALSELAKSLNGDEIIKKMTQGAQQMSESAGRAAKDAAHQATQAASGG